MKKSVDAAILFADIEGFSSISNLKNTNDLNEIINKLLSKKIVQLIQDHGGQIKNQMGDGFLVIFEINQPSKHQFSRIDQDLINNRNTTIFDCILCSIRCACEMHQEYMNSFEKSEPKIKIRIGIHKGRVNFAEIPFYGLEISNDSGSLHDSQESKSNIIKIQNSPVIKNQVFGPDVNLGQRIESAGKGNCILVSQAIMDEILNEDGLQSIKLIFDKFKKEDISTNTQVSTKPNNLNNIRIVNMIQNSKLKKLYNYLKLLKMDWLFKFKTGLNKITNSEFKSKKEFSKYIKFIGSLTFKNVASRNNTYAVKLFNIPTRKDLIDNMNLPKIWDKISKSVTILLVVILFAVTLFYNYSKSIKPILIINNVIPFYIRIHGKELYVSNLDTTNLYKTYALKLNYLKNKKKFSLRNDPTQIDLNNPIIYNDTNIVIKRKINSTTNDILNTKKSILFTTGINSKFVNFNKETNSIVQSYITDGSSSESRSDNIGYFNSNDDYKIAITNYSSNKINIFEYKDTLSYLRSFEIDSNIGYIQNPSGAYFINDSILAISLYSQFISSPKIRLYNIKIGQIQDKMVTEKHLNSVIGHNNYLYTCSDDDSKIFRILIDNDKTIRLSKVDTINLLSGSPTEMLISPSSNYLYVSHRKNKNIDIINLNTFTVEEHIDLEINYPDITMEGFGVDWENDIFYLADLKNKSIYGFAFTSKMKK